jgi:hypothetical protein
MKNTTGPILAGLALFASSLVGVSAEQFAFAEDFVVAQASGGAQSRPEVNPRIDNPNNPSVPGHRTTDPQSTPTDDADRQRTPNSTAEGRSRCGTLTETLARRRCLEELQRNRNN